MFFEKTIDGVCFYKMLTAYNVNMDNMCTKWIALFTSENYIVVGGLRVGVLPYKIITISRAE